MIITKQEIEEQLGYEIKDFNVTPVILDDEIVGYNVMVEPISKVEFINVSIKVTPSSTFDDV